MLTGYNGLTQLPPLNRSELYELWWRQSLFEEKLIVRVGKSVPTFDFNNVIRALPLKGEVPYVAAVSGLIYTTIFVNPSILGVMPGYYNSAWGITTTATPHPQYWASYGIYDGSLAGEDKPAPMPDRRLTATTSTLAKSVTTGPANTPARLPSAAGDRAE